MTFLLSIFLIWLPIAVFLSDCVFVEDAQSLTGTNFTKFWKKALFFILTVPVLWIKILTIFAHKHSDLKIFQAIGQWFKS